MPVVCGITCCEKWTTGAGTILLYESYGKLPGSITNPILKPADSGYRKKFFSPVNRSDSIQHKKVTFSEGDIYFNRYKKTLTITIYSLPDTGIFFKIT
jgi:hypothetical protein